MESRKCEIDGCVNEVKIVIMRPITYVQVEDKYYCPGHGAEVLNKITSEFAQQREGIQANVNSCAVEIELVVCDGREGWPSQVFLHESHGPRRLTFKTGRFESWLLGWELRHEPAESLSTHRAMVSLLAALGGDSKMVTMNDVSEGERYHAQIHLSQGNSPVIVDVRPSDAIVLAVVCNLPIYVDSLVWQKILH